MTADPHLSEQQAIGVPLPPRELVAHNVQYGAPFVAAAYCRLPGAPPSGIRGEWQHGWHPPEHNIHPELVVGSTGLSREHRVTRIFWVARKDQVDYLSSHGYRRVKAIGMPILYLPKLAVRREPRSLLVMPVHSLETTRHKWNFDQYVEQIASIRHRFSRVVACVHPECIKKGYWAPQFAARGIPVVSGAQINDKNALLRMGVLFSRFEFVTTNGFGSHLAYAAHFRAKPSIYGALAKYAEADYKDDLIFRNCPELLPLLLEVRRSGNLRKLYAEFFCDPWMAKERKKWADFHLGEKHKLRAGQLLQVFFNLKTRLIRYPFSLINEQSPSGERSR